MTNGIRPARFRTHIRSSIARASATVLYIRTRSSSVRPTDRASSDSFDVLVAITRPRWPSEVDRPAVDSEGRLADDLAQGRMGVGRAADLPRRRLELEREGRLGDEVRRVRPDEVD